MKNEKYKVSCGYQLPKYNFIFQPLNELLKKMIPSGIPQHLYEYVKWFIARPADKEVEDPRRVLSMFDLEFGFVLFLIAIAASFIVFLWEVLSFNLKIKMKKIVSDFIGLLQFLKILRTKLLTYHDTW